MTLSTSLQLQCSVISMLYFLRALYNKIQDVDPTEAIAKESHERTLERVWNADEEENEKSCCALMNKNE